MADNDHMKQHEDQGFFGAKQSINQMGLGCGSGAAAAFAIGLVRGGIQELVSLIGEREAFEWVMKQAEAIIREPDTTAGKIWTPTKKDG